MNITLTPLQAFNAMTKLVENYYNTSASDDAGSLLGDMLFVEEFCTADPGAWNAWNRFIQNKSNLTKQEAFEGMIKFLSNYQMKTHSADIKWLVDDFLCISNHSTVASTSKKLWDTYINESLQESDDYRNYLDLTK